MLVLKKRTRSLSRRAVVRRLSQRLAAENLVLRKCPARSRWHSTLGDYYLTTTLLGYLAATHQHLDELAHDYGVIGEGQQIEGE